MNRTATGRWGEKLAADHLIQKGYAILAMNFRSPLGEIDIIARTGDCIVFVEVKCRRDLAYGYPREAVGKAKQRRIKKIALFYVSRGKGTEDYRFDVVEIVDPNNPRITHIENAFW